MNVNAQFQNRYRLETLILEHMADDVARALDRIGVWAEDLGPALEAMYRGETIERVYYDRSNPRVEGGSRGVGCGK